MKALFKVTAGLKRENPFGNYDSVNVIATDAISAAWKGLDKMKKGYEGKAPNLTVNDVSLIDEIG